ncbi:unnamed protein product [Brachionus calyciflorus]|uniref:Uncharacterized protein n=1 Tax=Brachionus calyciflorus TaxID=104777 RepID=A0A814FIN2_9BILA|nr:unnamed protein product [Brachionus calyciflorus]
MLVLSPFLKDSGVPKKEHLNENVVAFQFNSPDSAMQSPTAERDCQFEMYHSSFNSIESEYNSLKRDNKDLKNYVTKITKTSSIMFSEYSDIEKQLDEQNKENLENEKLCLKTKIGSDRENRQNEIELEKNLKTIELLEIQCEWKNKSQWKNCKSDNHNCIDSCKDAEKFFEEHY